MTELGFVFLGAIVLFLAVIIIKGVIIVQQAQVMIIENFGKFSRVLNPGLHIIIPVMEKPHEMEWRGSREYMDGSGRTHAVPYIAMRDTIDMRETVYDFPRRITSALKLTHCYISKLPTR